MTAPERWAALSADLPFTTVSRCAPPPRARLPILVTVSQSSMLVVMCREEDENVVVDAEERRSGIDAECLWWTCGCGLKEGLLTEYHRICGEAVVAKAWPGDSCAKLLW